MKLYNQSEIKSLEWPNTENGQLAKELILPMIEEGTEPFFHNVSTQLLVLKFDDIVLPITVNDRVIQNSYVCSSYTHYVLYALDEIKKIKTFAVRRLAEAGIYVFGSFLKWGEIDRTVFVNNWLLPTNLYPTLSEEQVERIANFLLKSFPDHMIAFRSINILCPNDLINTLQANGFNLLLCRDIYYTDTNKSEPFKARMTKSDFKKLNSSSHKIISNEKIPEETCFRIARLYGMLNVDKYSECNPQYTPRFIQLIRQIPRFTLKTFSKDGQIDATLGYYSQSGITTSPLFGYDTSTSQDIGLYRQISALLLKDAKEDKMLLHQSSGAGQYKQLRRAKKELEYTAIHIDHLSFRRRLPWKVLLFGMNTFGKKILSGYNNSRK